MVFWEAVFDESHHINLPHVSSLHTKTSHTSRTSHQPAACGFVSQLPPRFHRGHVMYDVTACGLGLGTLCTALLYARLAGKDDGSTF